MCGITVGHDFQVVYDMLNALQHRGKDAGGLAAISDDRIDVIKWKGKVSAFDSKDLRNMFPQSFYHTYMGHVRYMTTGREERILDDGHPVTVGGKRIDRGDHIIVLDCDAAMIHNGQVDPSNMDLEARVSRDDIDTKSLLHMYIEKGAREIIKRLPGAYTLAVADKQSKSVKVMRDPLGMIPGVIGTKGGKTVVASEDIAFIKTRAETTKDLERGAIYYLKPAGKFEEELIVQKEKPRHCMFQWNYTGDRQSTLDGRLVRQLRRKFGIALAEEHAIEADIYSFIPRCPEPAVESYTDHIGKKVTKLLYKKKGDRAFLGATAEARKESINTNVGVFPYIEHKGILLDAKEYLVGKHIVLIDDSIVRGNNSKEIIKLLKSYGVEKITLLSYTPPLGIYDKSNKPTGCEWGTDMPITDAFVARGEAGKNRTPQEINEIIGAEVYYLSFQKHAQVYESFGLKQDELCMRCIGGPHPIKE